MADKLTEVKTAMLLHQPFFAAIMLDYMKLQVGKFPEIFGNRTATAATDGKNVWFDEDFFESLTLPERVFVLCHEIGHSIWAHMARAKGYEDCGFDGEAFDHGRWNRAGDYVINDMLVRSGVGKMPNCGLHDPSKYSADMMADNVYRLLKDDPEDGEGPGHGDGGSLDHHIPANAQATDAEMKRVVATASEAAKAQGKMPADLQRIVDQLLEPQVDWAQLLRKAFTRVVGRDATTWATPHRKRLITQRVVMPSYTGFGAGWVVFIMDTSGSMSNPEMRVGLTECDSILTDVQAERVTLIGCDAEVNSVHELMVGETLAGNIPPLGGGGGTSFVPPFDWIAEQGGKGPDCIVYFTDMYGSFPDDPGISTIWCATTDKEAPFGNTIKVDLNGG